MLHDPQFWVAISFVLFVAAVFKPVGKVICASLDNRSLKIQKDLDEALRLKEEAQALLASYQRKQKEAAEEAHKILENAKTESERLLADAEKKLEENLNKKIQLAMQKIANYEHSVMQEVRNNSIDLAINTVRRLIEESLNKKISDDLVSRAVAEMNSKLH